MNDINWPELVAALTALALALASYLKARTAAAEARNASVLAEDTELSTRDAHARLDRTDAAIGASVLGGVWSSRDDERA